MITFAIIIGVIRTIGCGIKAVIAVTYRNLEQRVNPPDVPGTVQLLTHYTSAVVYLPQSRAMRQFTRRAGNSAAIYTLHLSSSLLTAV